MPQILLRGLDEKTVRRLKDRARRRGRSSRREVKDILERTATTLTMEETRTSSVPASARSRRISLPTMSKTTGTS